MLTLLSRPWDVNNYPPPDKNEFMKWISGYQWPQVEPDLIKIIGQLTQDGASKIGVYGFCWGGKIAVQSTTLVGAAAAVHPAFLEVADADKIVRPFCLLPSKDEDKKTMDALFDKIKAKPIIGEKSVYKVFSKQHPSSLIDLTICS